MTGAGGERATLLAVRIGGMAGTAGIADAEEWRLELDQAVATLCGLLAEYGGCVRARSEALELEGLFPDPDSAYAAARRVLTVCANPVDHRVPAPVRLLLTGPGASEATADVLSSIGAAEDRLMRYLPADRIFATQRVTALLNDAVRARFTPLTPDTLDATQLGVGMPVVYSDEPTTVFVMPATPQAPACPDRRLALRWREHAVTLHPESPPLTFGRGSESSVQIESNLVSRQHARLEFRDTNFVLADLSTNGTFVRIEQDEEVFLHREQIVLRGNGVISLGRRSVAGGGKLIYFSLTG